MKPGNYNGGRKMKKSVRHTAEDVRELVEEYIDKNNLVQDMPLPPEREFSQTLDVNRATLRKVLSCMCNENKLYTVNGKGTFVAPEKFLETADRYVSLTSGWSADGHRIRSRILSFDTAEASIKTAQMLGIPLGSPLHELRRLRFIDDIPVFIETSYIPVSLCPGLIEYEFKEDTSLYAVLADRFDIRITTQQQSIRTAELTEFEMQLFENPRTSKAFCSIAVGCDEEGKPVEHSISIARADIYAVTYVAEIAPGGKAG